MFNGRNRFEEDDQENVSCVCSDRSWSANDFINVDPHIINGRYACQFGEIYNYNKLIKFDIQTRKKNSDACRRIR